MLKLRHKWVLTAQHSRSSMSIKIPPIYQLIIEDTNKQSTRRPDKGRNRDRPPVPKIAFTSDPEEEFKQEEVLKSFRENSPRKTPRRQGANGQNIDISDEEENNDFYDNSGQVQEYAEDL